MAKQGSNNQFSYADYHNTKVYGRGPTEPRRFVVAVRLALLCWLGQSRLDRAGGVRGGGVRGGQAGLGTVRDVEAAARPGSRAAGQEFSARACGGRGRSQNVGRRVCTL
ncbi:unnamed protein product [Calypogeia fissa]